MREVIFEDGRRVIKSPWLRIDEAAAYCGISRSCFDDRARESDLPHGGDGRMRLYHTEVLDRWLNGLLAAPFAPQPKRRQRRIVLTARQDGRRARLAMVDDDDVIVDPANGKVYR